MFVSVVEYVSVFSFITVCEIINPDPQWFMVRPTEKKNNLIVSGDHF